MDQYDYRDERSARTRTPKRRKKRKRQPLGGLLVPMLVVLFGAIAVGIYSLIFNKQQSTVSMKPTPIAVSSTYWNTGDGILYQTDGQIHFYHLNDQKRNYTYGTAASDIRMAGSSSMTAVYNDLQMQIIGKPQTIAFSGIVQDMECGYEHVAVLQRNADTDEQRIVILTMDGVEVDQLTFEDDQYPVDFGFYRVNGEKLWIETLSVNAGTPTTSIRNYDISKKSTIGIMQIQSQLIDDIYVTPDSIFVVGTNQVIRYTHEGNKEVYRHTVYGYRVIDYTLSTNPTFLMTPRGGDMHSVKMLTLTEANAASPTETYLQLPTEGVAAYMMHGQLIVISREKLYTYSAKGKLSKEASFEIPVDDAVKLTENVLLLSANGMYYLAKV